MSAETPRRRRGGSPAAREITALLREARELRGCQDEGRREAFLARKQQLLEQLDGDGPAQPGERA